MALTAVVRRTASSLLPVASRLIRAQRNHHSAIFAALNRHSKPSLSPFATTFRFYSRPASDENLLRVIESEIKCAEETDQNEGVEEKPSDFPFEIQDNPGQQTITLTREYQGEEITVEVHMPDHFTGEEDDDNDDEGEKANQSSISLVANVSKKNGPLLEFGCTAYPDEIQIDSLSIKNPDNTEDQIAYEGPDFHDLDENLQKAFQKYLEVRGIKPSATNFLYEYMINKDSREYLMWLKNVKKFIEA